MWGVVVVGLGLWVEGLVGVWRGGWCLIDLIGRERGGAWGGRWWGGEVRGFFLVWWEGGSRGGEGMWNWRVLALSLSHTVWGR